MILYAVQWHRLPLPPHADENDLDWTTWTGHDDYVDEQEAEEAALEFDAAFDGAYVHRVVARRAEGPGVARAGSAAHSSEQSTQGDGQAAPTSAERGRATG